MAVDDTDPVDEDQEATGVLDELAAFLMHHAYDPGVSDVDRLQTFAIVEAHQEGDDPMTVELTLREMAMRFRDDPAYRPEWLPRERPQT